MKVLLCHNYYQQPGGEDQVFADEANMLIEHGHEVVRYTRHNDVIDDMGKLTAAKNTLWNQESYRDIRELIQTEQPDVMHCTNIFPLISPAAYYAAGAEDVAVVQSLHNYRLLCPNAVFVRDGRMCQDCVGKKFAWPAVVHGCYRQSTAGSGVVASMVGLHRSFRTWSHAVDRYIALTEDGKRLFVKGGIPEHKIDVKPNCVAPDPGIGSGSGEYAVFVGRIVEEKGIETLLEAWSTLDARLPLKIVGDGPLTPLVKQAAAQDDRIEWLGWQDLDRVLSIIGEAKFLVFPSIMYEPFGRSIAEAFATGTPVIASRRGAAGDLVTHEQTGLHFEADNAADLVARVQQAIANPEALGRMRIEARVEFERKYTSAANYEKLIAIYEAAIHEARPSTTAVA